jgi:AraC family transcriptional regulator
LDAGYESQQAFTLAFKKLYKVSPQAFRKKLDFYPIQLKFHVDGNLNKLRGDRIMDIRMEEKEIIYLIGYMGNTKKGFFVIPRLWHKLHKVKNHISNRTNMDYLVGVNDYSKNFSYEDKNPAFDYYAVVEVSNLEQIPAKMQAITLKAGKYVIFTFRGKTKDSLQPVIEYIYKEWLPQSSCLLNENAKYEFIRYGEIADEMGQSSIEVWIPIV